MLRQAKLEHSDAGILAHDPQECARQMACPIHHRTAHSMRAFKQHWRDDRGIMERICPHGVGHPDPDQFPRWRAKGLMVEAVHGCDGCCGGGGA